MDTVTPSHAERDGASRTHRDEAESIKGDGYKSFSIKTRLIRRKNML